METINDPCRQLLAENGWLSGFIDGDGHFHLRTSKNKIGNEFYLEQGDLEIFLGIGSLLGVEVKSRGKSGLLRLRTASFLTNKKVISYLEDWPLFTSNYLDYLDWKKAFDSHLEWKANTIKILTAPHYDIFLSFKKRMNDNRSHFDWSHLQSFYK